MNRILPAMTALLLALALVSCAAPRKQKDLDDTLRRYESIVRWSEWDGAANFLAPEFLAEHPVSRLDMERLRLFRVTQYTVRAAVPFDDGDRYQQTVEIRLFNRNRAVEKVVLDHQDWKYDEASGRWLLHSGLPDVTQRH